jgi:hypothetical protein
MRYLLALALVASAGMGLSACARPGSIQTDRTQFTPDGTFQRNAYSQTVVSTFDKTVGVFREAGYTLDIVDRAAGQISGRRGKTGDKDAQRSDDLRFVALVLPGPDGVGSVLTLKFVQVSPVGVPVLNRAKAEVVLTQPELYAYVFSRIN